jgi:hypothetical protein
LRERVARREAAGRERARMLDRDHDGIADATGVF